MIKFIIGCCIVILYTFVSGVVNIIVKHQNMKTNEWTQEDVLLFSIFWGICVPVHGLRYFFCYFVPYLLYPVWKPIYFIWKIPGVIYNIKLLNIKSKNVSIKSKITSYLIYKFHRQKKYSDEFCPSCKKKMERGVYR